MFYKPFYNKTILIRVMMIIAVSICCCLLFIMASSKDSPTVNNEQKTRNNIGNLINSGFVTYDGSNTYYLSVIDGRIVLAKTDHEGVKSILSENMCYYLNIVDNYIYYIDSEDQNIYKMDTDGNNNMKISDLKAEFLYEYRELLYVIASTEDSTNKLYSMNLDGTDLKVLSEDKIYQVNIEEETIYYKTYKERSILYKMNLDGLNKSEIECAQEDSISLFHVYKGNIYYIGDDTTQEIRKINILDNSISKLKSSTVKKGFIWPGYIAWQDNIMIYCDIGTFAFKQFDLDTEELLTELKYAKKTSISPGFYIVDDRLFYYQNDILYMTTLDGKTKKKIG